MKNNILHRGDHPKNPPIKHFFRIMRITLFLLLTCAFSSYAGNSYSQNRKISLDLNNVELKAVLEKIESQTDYLFIYNSLISTNKRVSIKVDKMEVATILKQILKNTDINFKLEGSHIILSKKAESVSATEVTQQAKKNVTGTVVDKMGETIIGANVKVQSADRGTITDVDGRFSIEAKPGDVLLITYIGYTDAKYTVDNQPNIKIVLSEENKILDEVVVVGFGTQRKVNLTGAVDVIDSKQLQERPVANATQALQGMVPGLQITQGSGSIESRPSINVRGTATIGEGTSGDPLILIDGMEANLSSVNPQDIESISVLKDAAASAIYGSRAPFGVILITTKNGKDGKVTVNYNNSFRFGSPINMKSMMNSVDFASWMNNTLVNGGGAVVFGSNPDGTDRFDQIVEYHNATPVSNGVRKTADGKLVYAIPSYNSMGQWDGGFSRGVDDVDYYKVVYKKWAFSQEHNFSASGGSKKFNYYASGSYFNQNGLINLGEEGLNRFTATAKINSELTSWLSFRYSMRFTREDQNRPKSLENVYDLLGANAWPVLPQYDQNGTPYYSSPTSVWSLEYGGKIKKQNDNTYHQLGFTLEPIKNWKTNVDFNYRINLVNLHNDKLPYYNYDINGVQYARETTSYVHEEFYKGNYYNFNARTEYAFSLQKKHNFNVMGGMQIENYKVKEFGATRNGLIVNGKTEIDTTSGLQDGEAKVPSVNGDSKQWGTVGVFGRLNYNYNSRYLFEVNVRRDGSSRFRKGNQWKTFPSFSAGWNIGEEEFMSGTRNWLDMLKIRVSYGSLGNQNTNNWYYTYMTMAMNPQGSTWLQNGKKVNTASVPALISENLTWEQIETYNIGADFAFLDNRLTGSFNWYIRNTNNMVGNAPKLPSVLGAAVPKTNNTDLRTQGWELSIGWRDRLNNGLTYNARFNLFDSRTKITRYPNNPTGYLDSYLENYYTGDIWGLETIGIAKTDEEMQNHLATLPNGGQNAIGSKWAAGDIMYKDLDGNGYISKGTETINDHGDLKVIGNSRSRYQFGLDLSAAWKGFDVRAFFTGTMKRDYWIGSAYMFGATGNGQWQCAGITAVGDYFRDENTWSVQKGVQDVNLNAYLPRPLYSSKNLQKQTRYLQNAAFIRLKNFTLGYTLPKGITDKWGIGSTRIFLSGENLWTGTKLAKQFDPETIETNLGNAYPLSRTFSCGLNINF